MRKILLSITLAAMIWSACSKSDLPQGVQENPVFSIALTSSFEDTSLTAGKDGIYLFTKVERGLDSVLVMSGTFDHASCQSGNCPGIVRFEFRNNSKENFIEPGFIFGPDYNWEFKSPSTDPPFQNTVSIQWMTYGRIFRSELVQQDSISYFDIQQSEPWEKNERGENTWKMNVNFSCFMLDSLSQQLKTITGSGVIAVGYR